MSDFSEDDELPDISFNSATRLTPGKCIINKQDQKIVTPKIKQENRILTVLKSELQDITDGLKELTDGSLKAANISQKLSTPSPQHNKKWRRHSAPNAKDNPSSTKSDVSGRMPNISLALTPTSTQGPLASFPHASFSPGTSSLKTSHIGGSPLSPLAQRCLQRISGRVESSLKEKFMKEKSQMQKNFNQDKPVPSLRNSTNNPHVISNENVMPLLKEIKLELVAGNISIETCLREQSNVIKQANRSTSPIRKLNSETENMSSTPTGKINSETGNMSTPPTGKFHSAAENMSTPPSRKKKFGIESSPGSDLLERCLKKLGYDETDDLKKNIKHDNIGNEKKLDNTNDVSSNAGSISDIKHRLLFGKDNRNIENELNIRKIASPPTKLDVVDKKSNVGSVLTKISVGKSWNEDYKMKSEVFHNETMMNIISETTKKCRCNCRRGDCSRKQCSCNRSGGTCGSHCGCQLSLCKNRMEPKKSPSSRKALTQLSNTNLSPKRIILSPLNMVKHSIQTASISGKSSPSGETTFVDSHKDDRLKCFRLKDNTIPVNVLKTTSGENSMCIKTPLPTDKNIFNNSSNQILTNSMIMNNTQSDKVLPSTSKNGATIFENRMSLQSGDLSLPMTSELIDTNSLSVSHLQSNDDSSTLVTESRSESRTDRTVPDKGNSVLLIPESLNFLRNACGSSMANPNNKSTMAKSCNDLSSDIQNETAQATKINEITNTHSSNDLSIDIQNGTVQAANLDNENTMAHSGYDLSINIQNGKVQKASTSQSETSSSLLDTEIFETSFNSNTSTILDETDLFDGNSLDETVPYDNNLLNETLPYHNNLNSRTVPSHNNLMDETVPFMGNLVQQTAFNNEILDRSTPLFQIGPTRTSVEDTNQAKKISKQRPSSDDLGYASDSQPPIKRIRINHLILNKDIKAEVDSGRSWDQIKIEKSDVGEDQLCGLINGQQKIQANPIENPGCSTSSWHRPHTAKNSVQDIKATQIKQETFSPLCIKKEDDEILPSALVKVLLKNTNMRETKSNLLTEFHPAPLNKVINDNPQLFRVQLCMISDVQIILAPTNVSICGGHSGPDGCRSRAMCTALHICPNFVDSKCSDEFCIFGHSFCTNHNKEVLKKLHLENVEATLLCKLLAPVVKILEPKHLLDICKDYNWSGCNNPRCNNLHVCHSFVIGKCKCSRLNCSLNHNILNDKCRELLSKAGIDTNETPRDVIVALLTLNSSISETNP